MHEAEIPESVFAELLASEDEMWVAAIHNVRTTFRTYPRVTDRELGDSFHQNIQMSIAAVRRGSLPDPEELERYAHISRSRFEKGVLVDELIRAFRFSIGIIADRLAQILRERGYPGELGVHAYRLIWQTSDDYTSRLVGEYRRHQLRLDAQNREMKADILNRLQAGTVDEDTLRLVSSRFNLSRDEPVSAFRAKPTDPDTDVLDVMVHADTALVRGKGFAAIHGDHVIGICAEPISIRGPVAVAYGHRASLVNLPESFASAEAVLSTSWGLRPGHYTLEDVTWRALVDAQNPLMQHLSTHYWDPLIDRISDPDALMLTVQAYLDADRSYGRAAAQLHCHPNTVRYRIARFEQLTGTTTNSTEHITSLMWFLEARARIGSERAG